MAPSSVMFITFWSDAARMLSEVASTASLKVRIKRSSFKSRVKFTKCGLIPSCTKSSARRAGVVSTTGCRLLPKASSTNPDWAVR